MTEPVLAITGIDRHEQYGKQQPGGTRLVPFLAGKDLQHDRVSSGHYQL